MGDEKEPTQRTEQGHEIPVPTREQVFRDLEKAIQPVQEPPEDSGGDGEDGAGE